MTGKTRFVNFSLMNLVQDFIARAAKNPVRVVYPEGKDTRIIAAALEVKRLGIAHPILLGERIEVEEAAAAENLSLTGLQILSPKNASMVERYAAEYSRSRGVDIGVARKLVSKPLSFGGMMAVSYTHL
ncbi:MAG: phosphate acyltransferase, partial [Kiritimatiellae bacterium]|nr:phosphate acyltransferase [Kiritimatiellia bacterium]